jgi:hypothetical protein
MSRIKIGAMHIAVLSPPAPQAPANDNAVCWLVWEQALAAPARQLNHYEITVFLALLAHRSVYGPEKNEVLVLQEFLAAMQVTALADISAAQFMAAVAWLVGQ